MSEDCQKCGTAMYDLDEERLCPGCSNHETETEAMTTNQTIDDIKSRAKFFKAGSIIPRNILKCSRRKYQHIARFGSDTWAIPGETGWVCIQHHSEGSSAIKFVRGQRGDLVFSGSPYQSGDSHWECDFQRSEKDFLSAVIERLGR